MRYQLNVRDLLKGLLVSVITSVLVVVQNSIETGNLTFNWKAIVMAAIGSAVAYLLKNFFTDDMKTAIKVIDEAKKSEVINTPGGNTIDISNAPEKK